MILQNRLNQEMSTTSHINTGSTSRMFGLHSRNSSSVSNLYQDDDMRGNSISDSMHHRNNSTVSKTFGLISEVNGMIPQNSRRYNQDMRRNNSCNSSLMPNPFGLQARTLTLQTNDFSQSSSRINRETSLMNLRSTMPRTCMGSDNLSGLITQNNEGFNQNLRRNINVNTSLIKPFGLQSRNLTQNSDLDLRLNHDSTLRSNNISAISKTFGPASRNKTGFNMQENSRYNDEVINDGGFRRPTLSRVIRGRSSILSSRLFQNQNTQRHCKDLSNINGFNVSHISLRDVDSQSDSRLALNTRSNWMDNQSMSGSILSAASIKSQFMNVLENLHHSILNIGPHVTPEAVRMEFDRAKQRLENISEMSFAPSVKENGTASVISQSSKYTCPPIIEPTTSEFAEESTFQLKSSKDLLKTLISGKSNYRDKCNLTTHMEEEEREKLSTVSGAQNRKSNEESVFKKPEPYIRKNGKKRSSRLFKIKTPEMVKNFRSATSNKVINLKQWYPIAVGSDLALCGVDEEGVTVRTEAVKKRLNNRKVELINGVGCNLIGSPSTMVSVLPKKIITLLKNGLTDRWRVLQKELLNCQTAEEETKKRVSKSPKLKKSPEKKKEKTPVGNKKTKKSRTPKVTSTPKKKINEVRTRSGRTIKPPSMFWIATGSDEVSSTLERSTLDQTLSEKSTKAKTNISVNAETPKKTTRGSPDKNHKKTVRASPKKKAKTMAASKKGSQKSPGRNLRESPRKHKKSDDSFKNSKKEHSKMRSPRKVKKTESEEETKVHSSTEDGKKEYKGREIKGKRKRDVNADAESVQAKKSKLEKETETTVESTVQNSKYVLKSEKKSKKGFTISKRSPKPKSKNSSTKTKKDVKKKTKNNDGKKETKEIKEFEEDFELKLDDIEIPEIANVSGNPQLSRSQLRLISMETPPLKYFNTHLNLLKSVTPVRSPSWCISQRTESEVKQFQKRREEAFKKKLKVDVKKTVITEKIKNVQNRDVKKVVEWVAEKTVRSPQWNSKVLQYVIPSRKQLEERMNDEDDEDFENDFL